MAGAPQSNDGRHRRHARVAAILRARSRTVLLARRRHDRRRRQPAVLPRLHDGAAAKVLLRALSSRDRGDGHDHSGGALLRVGGRTERRTARAGYVVSGPRVAAGRQHVPLSLVPALFRRRPLHRVDEPQGGVDAARQGGHRGVGRHRRRRLLKHQPDGGDPLRRHREVDEGHLHPAAAVHAAPPPAGQDRRVAQHRRASPVDARLLRHDRLPARRDASPDARYRRPLQRHAPDGRPPRRLPRLQAAHRVSVLGAHVPQRRARRRTDALIAQLFPVREDAAVADAHATGPQRRRLRRRLSRIPKTVRVTRVLRVVVGVARVGRLRVASAQRHDARHTRRR